MNDPEIIIGEAYVYFDISIYGALTEVEFLNGLGLAPDSFTTGYAIDGGFWGSWKITTPMTEDPYLHPMIRGIVARLLPVKEQLIAFKQAYPDLQYKLTIVLYQGIGTAGLSFYNDTLGFLSEIGAIVDCDIYRK